MNMAFFLRSVDLRAATSQSQNGCHSVSSQLSSLFFSFFLLLHTPVFGPSRSRDTSTCFIDLDPKSE